MSQESDVEGAPDVSGVASLLDTVDDASVVRPSADPHAAAMTALLVADYLGQPDLRGKLGSVGMSSRDVDDLRRLARAIVTLVTHLGGDYLPDARGIPGDLVQRAQGVRSSISAALEKALPDDPDVRAWLEAIRLGNGVVDLVYDLRTLADLCVQHGKANAAANATAGAVQSALAAADAVEFALRTADSPESTKQRNTVARLWTLFRPAYDRAAAAGRAMTRGLGRERHFPPLALVASHRRARRRPLSLVPTAAAAARRSAPPRANTSRPPRADGSPKSSVKIPSSPALPDIADIELIEGELLDDADILRSEPPAPLPPPPRPEASKVPSKPPTSGERLSWSDTRKSNRQPIEIEVGIASQSNFYLGFTENLSNAGVFVATYASKPIGERVEVALAFPNGEQLKVHGFVRWLREATSDGWPGMGVQFESLSPQDETTIRKFLSLRDPLFYDD
jgi:uncharacterized protein (TIGR02266 family)